MCVQSRLKTTFHQSSFSLGRPLMHTVRVYLKSKNIRDVQGMFKWLPGRGKMGCGSILKGTWQRLVIYNHYPLVHFYALHPLKKTCKKKKRWGKKCCSVCYQEEKVMQTGNEMWDVKIVVWLSMTWMLWEITSRVALKFELNQKYLYKTRIIIRSNFHSIFFLLGHAHTEKTLSLL